ncbi:TetR/AcrR family transcriptional regulator [Maribacter polysaccharolyticus]|uniref:TetR/AcrR family transcriptional regulator n=1 Tax=Maribacter polysaccharolyticus TaxID=3020831 RepID=UPI00237FCADF|nr:TetR/AcrR family transcriptional regulator [Maribacter polysaccharolyticus]MDE3741275.1 TetR/AcrR family transcriptional regulator [Maribacter polysaccharolyticus]
MNKDYIQTGRVNQKLETRELILVSAQELLKKGRDFSLEDVAKKAGISRATIYRYYSNKEILAAEAGLDITTLSPDGVIKSLEGKGIEGMILGIQDYFNTLAIDNEKAFRKYLSLVITSDSPELKRGARRKKTLELALDHPEFTAKEKKDLANLLTLLMGIEPLIVSKDVVGLNNEGSKALLKWGIQLILKGYFGSKKQ